MRFLLLLLAWTVKGKTKLVRLSDNPVKHVNTKLYTYVSVRGGGSVLSSWSMHGVLTELNCMLIPGTVAVGTPKFVEPLVATVSSKRSAVASLWKKLPIGSVEYWPRPINADFSDATRTKALRHDRRTFLLW